MRHSLLIRTSAAAIVEIILGGTSVHAQNAGTSWMVLGSPKSEVPTISVTGEASVSVTPDLAIIEGGVASDAKTARAAADLNNTAMGAVMLALKGAGVAEKDMQTAQLSLQPQNAPIQSPNTSPQIVGYRAINHVTVTLHDVAQVASTIDTLVAAGANEINGISFSVSQASKLLDDARSQAIADAQRKAEIYAKAANVTLGAPLSITEGFVPSPMPMYARAMKVGAPTPIAVGEETLHVGVHVSYAIKQP